MNSDVNCVIQTRLPLS